MNGNGCHPSALPALPISAMDDLKQMLRNAWDMRWF